MKPLTIERLKALPVGDWVWVATVDGKYGAYGRVCQKFDDDNFRIETIESYLVDPYETYGTKWLAYKNKEQAEAKGETVELPCIEPFSTCNIETGEPCTCYNILYRDKASGELAIDCEVDKSEAERRLAELKGEKL